MKTTPYVIIVEVSQGSYDRTDLERIEGATFRSVDDAKNQLAKYNPMADRSKAVIIKPLYEFTTDWNDTDDEDKYLDIETTFISYINIVV